MRLSNFLTRTMAIGIAILSLSVASCTDIDSLEDPELESSNRAKLEYTCFDFSSTTDVDVTLSVGRRALVRIYAGDPDLGSAQELLTAACDEYGYCKTKMTIPKSLLGTNLYAVATDIKIKAQVNAEGVTFKSNSRVSRDAASTVLDQDWCEKWSEYYRDYLKEYADNSSLVARDNLNMDLDIIADTEITISFLYSGASITSKFYYYYYKENTTITAEDIYNKFAKDKTNRFQLFKDIATDGLINSAASNPDPSNTDNYKVGLTDKLYFYGEDLTDTEGSTTFTSDYNVGFFIVTTYDDIFPPFFTNNALNSYSRDAAIDKAYTPYDTFCRERLSSYPPEKINMLQAARFLTGDDNTIILGMEDNPAWLKSELIQGYPGLNQNYIYCDIDLNDLILAISIDQLSTKVDISDDTILGKEYTGSPLEGTLIFEDLYPNQGDYDMNDVMLEYSYNPVYSVSTDTENLSNATMIGVKCTFFTYHDGATYKNDLKIRWEGANSQICTVYENHKNYVNVIATASLNFSGDGVSSSEFLLSNFDPFIYVENTGYEVHLTGKTATDQATHKSNDEALKYYYCVNTYKDSNDDEYQGNYPFALCIPYYSGHNSGTWIKPCTESMRMENEYPAYPYWVSAAKKNLTVTGYINPYADWYKYYKSDEFLNKGTEGAESSE